MLTIFARAMNTATRMETPTITPVPPAPTVGPRPRLRDVLRWLRPRKEVDLSNL